MLIYIIDCGVEGSVFSFYLEIDKKLKSNINNIVNILTNNLSFDKKRTIPKVLRIERKFRKEDLTINCYSFLEKISCKNDLFEQEINKTMNQGNLPCPVFNKKDNGIDIELFIFKPSNNKS